MVSFLLTVLLIMLFLLVPHLTFFFSKKQRRTLHQTSFCRLLLLFLQSFVFKVSHMFSGNLMPALLLSQLTPATLSLNHPIYSMKSFPIFATILKIYYILVHICNTRLPL